MKTKQEIQKYLEWINQNIDGLTAKKVEAKKQLKKFEDQEFDFEKLMPEGSVWLGALEMMTPIWTGRPNYQSVKTQKEFAKSFYHAHKIVKAAQHYIINADGWHDLIDTVNAAKADGVLQNLE